MSYRASLQRPPGDTLGFRAGVVVVPSRIAALIAKHFDGVLGRLVSCL